MATKNLARCSGPASFGGKGMSRWPFLFKRLSYGPVNPFDSFHTWREFADPTFSISLDHYTDPLIGIEWMILH